MSNTGKKILILGIVIAIAIAGILAFYPTIVAPPTDVPVNNLHKSSLEANINGFPTRRIPFSMILFIMWSLTNLACTRVKDL